MIFDDWINPFIERLHKIYEDGAIDSGFHEYPNHNLLQCGGWHKIANNYNNYSGIMVHMA